MFNFKRILAVIIAGVMVGGVLPVQSSHLAIPNGRALVSVVRSTPSFNPGGDPATITYRVDTGRSFDRAENFQIKIYKVSASTSRAVLCNPNGPYITTIDGPANRPENMYNVRWNGEGAKGDGLYCFRATWSNPPPGAVGVREGYINLTSGSVGRTFEPATRGEPAARQPEPPQFPIMDVRNAVAEPSAFNPEIAMSVLRFTLNQDAHVTVSVRRRADGLFIATLAQNTFFASGDRSVSWNGRDTAGNLVRSGDYNFTVEAQAAYSTSRDSTTGAVTVERTGQQPPFGVMDVSAVSASPNPFNPETQNTALRFNLNHSAYATVTITDSAGGLVGQLAVNQFFQIGSNQVIWSGKYGPEVRARANEFVPAGIYNFRVDALSTSFGSDFGTGTVTVTRQTQTPPPPPATLDVSNVYTQPNSFNPEIQSTSLFFTINNGANVNVRVTDPYGALVHQIVSNQFYSAGTHQLTWAGSYTNGAMVGSGIYTFRVDASSTQGAGSDSGSAAVTVTRTGTTPPPTSTLDVSNVIAQPNPFNPETQNATISFTLNAGAYVTLKILDSNGALVKEFVSSQFYNSGTNNVVWNGVYGSPYSSYANQLVPAGNYTVRADALSSQFGSDSATGTFTVTRGSSSQLVQITDRGASPNPFNPRLFAETAIDFSATPTPSALSVRVYKGNRTALVRELNIDILGGNMFRARWNGRDANGVLVTDDAYTYTIEATAFAQTSSKSGNINVTSSTAVTVPPRDPYPPYQYSDCGSFDDVAENHSLCPAIDFVISRGIFVGYPDGSLGLDRVIQRAEFLAVIQKAFGFALEPYSPELDGDLGYRDLTNKTQEWYMPYIKTFDRLKIIQGYPDGRMRPEKTISNAEFFLVLLKAAKMAPRSITHFNISDTVTYPPFPDTPLEPDNRWYIKYAAFAKLNDLVRSEYFYPGRGITRGRVIQAIHDLYLKGLVDFGPEIR